MESIGVRIEIDLGPGFDLMVFFKKENGNYFIGRVAGENLISFSNAADAIANYHAWAKEQGIVDNLIPYNQGTSDLTPGQFKTFLYGILKDRMTPQQVDAWVKELIKRRMEDEKKKHQKLIENIKKRHQAIISELEEHYQIWS